MNGFCRRFALSLNGCAVYNKIMIEKSAKHAKQKQLKTQPFNDTEYLPFEFGKPIVRLPIINKKSGALRFRYDNTLDKSLDSKQKALASKNNQQKQESCLNVEELILRKYSNNSQLQLLTFEELQLCGDKSKKILPKITVGAPSRQNTDRCPNQEFHKRLNRMKSEKKIDSSMSDLGSYKLGPILGRGNYSIVKLCETSEGKKFAAKVYQKKKINSPQREQNLQEEIRILKSINHPNIISFKEHIETQENHYIVMEVFDNISLIEYIKKQGNGQQREENYSHTIISSEPNTTRFREKSRLTESAAKPIMKKILEAFLYLHENGIAHRDVKLQNVLIGTHSKDQITIKIIDFGFSRQVLENKSAQTNDLKQNKKDNLRKNSNSMGEQELTFYDYCGTPSYISPEIIEKKGYLARPSDVWALGILLFYVVTGLFPFRNVNEKSDFSNSTYSEIGLPNVKLSNCLTSMIKKMLRNDPLARPTVKQLLKQPWLHSQF